MYSQVLNKTCPYARSPPNFPHSEMTAKGAPIGSNLLVRTDPSPLAVICPESMPGAKITSYKPTDLLDSHNFRVATRELIGLVNTAFQSRLSAKRKLI